MSENEKRVLRCARYECASNDGKGVCVEAALMPEPEKCGMRLTPAVDHCAALARAEKAEADLARRTIERDRAKAFVEAIKGLINDSDGVAGLHKNGDVAWWCDIMVGGEHEGHVPSFDAALADEPEAKTT